VIKVNGLTKVYSNGRGIFDVDFEVKKGEVFGYLGPNGAGKTTTIRNLLGFLNPTRGTCTIDGLDCRTQADTIKKKLGYIPGETAFINEMTGTEFLNFIHNMRGTNDKTRRDELVERFGLDPRSRIKKMSKGTKQKLAVVTAFMHDPDVYVLDEPSSGLDPLMQQVFVELVREEKARGKTFLISSHMFEEIARTSDRAGIIRDGRLVAVEDVHELASSQRKTFVVSVESVEDVDVLLSSGLAVEKVSPNSVEVVVDDYGLFTATLARCRVTGIDVVSSALEQAFLKYYGTEAMS